MTEKNIIISGRECILFFDGTQPIAKILIVNGDAGMAELFRAQGIAPPQGGLIAMVLAKDRLAEYTPWPAKALRSSFPDFEGRADEYLGWLEAELFPRLQNEYGAALNASSTGLMGQSLGGLFTLYAQTSSLGKYFGTAVCISPSTWYPGFYAFFNSRLDSLPCKSWLFACGRNEGLGHNDIKQNVAAYNEAIIRRLTALHGENYVLTCWDNGSHHQYLPERFRWAVDNFFV